MTLIFLMIASGFIGYKIGSKTKLQRKYETWDINNSGEILVNNTLKKYFPRPNNYLLNNITLANNNGSTQIDHILINEYGIFVIETKHYSGWIFGKENDYKWTQSFRSGEKYTFLNPIKQNAGHINQLRNYLKHIPIESFISIVVFTGEGEIKSNIEVNNVIYLWNLTNYISQYKTPKLRLEEIHTIVGRLEFHRKEPCQATDEEHIQYVKSLNH